MVIKEQYKLIDGISIDFGVMQKTRKAYVIKCDFSWDDIGSFTALSRFLNTERNNSISKNDQNSLFLAIIAIIFAFISPIVSIILANIGISESKKQCNTQKDSVLSNKLNKAALIIAIASIIFSVLKTILSIAFDINIYGDLFV